MKKAVIGILALVLALGGAAAWLASDLYNYAHRPASSDMTTIRVAIAPGGRFTALTNRLLEAGLITHPSKFKMVARFKGYDKQLKAGEYLLSADMSPMTILDTMVSGRVQLHRLTVPEGYTIEQIATVIGTSDLAPPHDFITLARDPRICRALGIEAETLEGYLFPETYYFPMNTPARTIIETMVSHFNDQFSAAWRQRAEQLHLTRHQVVTLASIIEKETGAAEERPLISSVFHNRLRKKMRLESDPTVIYGIKDFDGNLTRKHLKTHTPYNTYKIRGLPPGPIANPGRAALEAALYPADTKYLYFVAKRDGTHYFSKTIAEHNRAVRKYQLRRRLRSRKAATKGG